MSEAKVIVKYLILLIAATSVVGCDRVTKHVATATLEGKPARSYFFDTVRLGYAENTGSFLSLGANLPSAVRFAVFVVVGRERDSMGWRWSQGAAHRIWRIGS